MAFRKMVTDMFSEVNNNKNVSRETTTDQPPELDHAKKCHEFYEKWVEYFTTIGNIEIKRLSRKAAENLHKELILKDKEFLEERTTIQSLDIKLEEEFISNTRYESIKKTNHWYENSFRLKLNLVANYLEKTQADITIEKKNATVNVKQPAIKNDQQIQAEKIYKKWLDHFEVISKLNLEELSEKEIGIFREEFNKKQHDFNQDKEKYLSDKKDKYIQGLCAEIEKKFNEEHAQGTIQINKIICQHLNRLLSEMRDIVLQRSTISSPKISRKIPEDLKYNFNLDIKEAKNLIKSLKRNNAQLSTELDFNEYIYKRKNEVEPIKNKYESFKKTLTDIQQDPSIKNLLETLNSTFTNFEEYPKLIEEIKKEIEINENLVIKYKCQLDIFAAMQTDYQTAEKSLNQRVTNYREMVEKYNSNVIAIADVNESMTWDAMFDVMKKIKSSLELEAAYLESLNVFYSFRTYPTLGGKINQLNDTLQYHKIILDDDSERQVKAIDNMNAKLKKDVYLAIQNSARKLIGLKSQSDELKTQMINLENNHLINDEYNQVRYLKFKAIKQYILKNEYFIKLKNYGNRDGSNKKAEIAKYISMIENSDNLLVLFNAVRCDLKLKAKSFSMRESSAQPSCSIARYSLFHQGKSKTDNYAKSLESDLIKFTQEICQVSCNEKPANLTHRTR